jgi:hypothetical protein
MGIEQNPSDLFGAEFVHSHMMFVGLPTRDTFDEFISELIGVCRL